MDAFEADRSEPGGDRDAPGDTGDAGSGGTVPIPRLTSGALRRLAAAVLGGTRLDTGEGVLLVRRGAVLRHRVPLETVTRASLTPSGNGVVRIMLASSTRRAATYLDVLALTDRSRRTQSPQTLRALADQLERRVPGGAAEVTRKLRRQADHIEASGSAAGPSLVD
ncbi:MAG: hypothetical protein ACXVW9_11000 [Nocardioidaceae bacterium]